MATTRILINVIITTGIIIFIKTTAAAVEVIIANIIMVVITLTKATETMKLCSGSRTNPNF